MLDLNGKQIPQGPGLKLNIGAGFRRLDGYVSVDSFPGCEPDVLWDLERTPWPFANNSVDEIFAFHVLEHIGQTPATFFAVIREIYRVVRHGGTIAAVVPHPLHRSFISDPTHVRPFTVETFLMFSRANNLKWQKAGKNVSMLALMLDVNFVPLRVEEFFDDKWKARIQNGEISETEARELGQSRYGVFREIRARLRVDKSYVGRS